MGAMVGVGCLARVLGPVTVSVIYTRFGTIWTFILTTVLQVVLTAWLIINEKRINNTIMSHTKVIAKEDCKDIEMVNLTQPYENEMNHR